MDWVGKMLGAFFARTSAPETPKAKPLSFAYVPMQRLEDVLHHFHRGPDDKRPLSSDDMAQSFVHAGKIMVATPVSNDKNTTFKEYGERLIVLGKRLHSMQSVGDNARIPRQHWDFLQNQGERLVQAAEIYDQSAILSKGQVVMPIAAQASAENLRVFAAKFERLAGFAAFGTEIIAEPPKKPVEQLPAPRQRPY